MLFIASSTKFSVINRKLYIIKLFERVTREAADNWMDFNNYLMSLLAALLEILHQKQKQPFRGALSKTFPENMQQIYRRTPMSKCHFNNVDLQHYWNHTSAWIFSSKFATCFQNTFVPRTPLNGCFRRNVADNWST